MDLKIGYRISFELTQATPMIALLNVHFSRAGALHFPDYLCPTPNVKLDGYRDLFGNWCTRFVAPPGLFSINSDTTITEDGSLDPQVPDAAQHPVELLPAETIYALLGSRYCDTDQLSERAWALFQNTPAGWARVQAICDYVHETVEFDYMKARATRTASETLTERVGVCRDFTHLAITFCRCMNIPARYCTGYLSDIGQPKPYPAGDFAAWMEVYLGGAWHVFDPRNNQRRQGRVLVAHGRDAADVPLIQSFGPNRMTEFVVWADEVSA